MFRSILVPLDGSDYSAQALPLAEQLAGLTQGRLDLVMVHQPPPVWYTPEAGVGDLSGFDEEARGRELRYLKGIEAELAGNSGLRVTTTLLDGEVSSAIGHFADQRGVDVVVMMTHARSGLSRLWLGSVADKLIRLLHIPVLVAHPDRARPRAVALRRIFVALDGSDVAASVLDHARMMAQLAGAEIVLGTVVEPVPAFLPPYEYPMPSAIDSNERRELHAREYLLMVQEYLRSFGSLLFLPTLIGGGLVLAGLLLGSRITALAMVLGGMQSPITSLVNCLAAPMRGVLGVLQARIQQLEGK